MNKNRFFLIATLAAVLICGVTLTVSRIRSHRALTSAVADAKLAQAATSRGGPHEGIKVHGHWTIDIRNPDGNLVAHHDFENALVPSPTLASLLGRTKTAGRWTIYLEEVGGVHPCRRDSGPPEPCTIQESPTGANNLTIWNTLKVTVPLTGENANKVVLTGSATAAFDTYINRVTTSLKLCLPDTSASACGATDGSEVGPMTQVYLAVPVNGTCPPETACIVHVLPDQIMQVKVVLSFS